jgi:hypothetical protein
VLFNIQNLFENSKCLKCHIAIATACFRTPAEARRPQCLKSQGPKALGFCSLLRRDEKGNKQRKSSLKPGENGRTVRFHSGTQRALFPDADPRMQCVFSRGTWAPKLTKRSILQQNLKVLGHATRLDTQILKQLCPDCVRLALARFSWMSKWAAVVRDCRLRAAGLMRLTYNKFSALGRAPTSNARFGDGHLQLLRPSASMHQVIYLLVYFCAMLS